MSVFLGAMFAWVIIGLVLGGSIFLLTVKGMVWPFVVTSLLLLWIIKRVGCSTH
ncbi:MAG: hypothetical protein JNN07_08090 [Verrucomicrobiales bacterium]|jgi:hypothetical protein|nr:hypothetical protein [Verrucomicrobiales bacterium]